MSNRDVSVYISYILRHNPGDIGLELGQYGYVDVNDLILGVNKKYSANVLNFDTLKEIVEHDSKKRYSFSEDFTKIRANQGHSIPIDLGLNPIEPPSVL